jgi:hypothetical protein
VEPISGAAAKNALVEPHTIEPSRIRPADGDPRAFEASDKSRTFGAPLEYQEPVTLRLGVRSTF